MGTSKAVLLSGIYLILGLYTVVFTQADENNFSAALNVALKSQAEQLALTGVSLALQQYADDAAMSSISSRTFATMGGTVKYSSSPLASDPSLAEVISTGDCSGYTMQTTAVFHYYGGRWKILQIYSKAV